MTKYDNLYKDFDIVSDIVVSYFDIDKSELITSNKENVVDARYCLIYILCDKYKDFDIAKVACVSKSVVNKIRNQINSNLRSYDFYNDLKVVKSLIK